MIKFTYNTVLCHFGRSDSLRQLLYKNKPDISNSATPPKMRRDGLFSPQILPAVSAAAMRCRIRI